MIYTIFYDNTIPFNLKEARRYFGLQTNEGTKEADELFLSCVSEGIAACTPKVVYGEFDCKIENGVVDLGFTVTKSKALAKNLQNCHKVIAFCATVGIGIDRLISRYQKLSPAKACAFQAIGAERVESVCDRFNGEVAERAARQGFTARPRFSCGYGDFPLTAQRDFFVALDCNRKIGVTLNDSLLMSPSKSVTAVIGLTKEKCLFSDNGCKECNKVDCTFRKDE